MNNGIKTITAKARLNFADGVDEGRRNLIVWLLDGIVREKFCGRDCLNFKKDDVSMYGGRTTYVHYLSRCFSNTEMKCVGVDLEGVVHTEYGIPDEIPNYKKYGIINASPKYPLSLNGQIVGEEVAMTDEVGLLVRFEDMVYGFGVKFSEILDIKMEYIMKDEVGNVCWYDGILKY